MKLHDHKRFKLILGVALLVSFVVLELGLLSGVAFLCLVFGIWCLLTY